MDFLFKVEYPAGYGLAVVSYVQMAVLCYTGQNVVNRVRSFHSLPNCVMIPIIFLYEFLYKKLQNNRLLEAFYNFKWYLLPIGDQKVLMNELLQMQNGVELRIGPFDQLNFETLNIVSNIVTQLSSNSSDFTFFLLLTIISVDSKGVLAFDVSISNWSINI